MREQKRQWNSSILSVFLFFSPINKYHLTLLPFLLVSICSLSSSLSFSSFLWKWGEKTLRLAFIVSVRARLSSSQNEKQWNQFKDHLHKRRIVKIKREQNNKCVSFVRCVCWRHRFWNGDGGSIEQCNVSHRRQLEKW